MTEPSECPHAANDDVLRQYARGTLSEEAANAYEEHLFGCDRCERELRRAVEVRAALSPAGAVTDSPRAVPLVKRRARTLSLSVAAALVLVLGLGFWQSRAPRSVDPLRSPRPIAQEPTRGSDAPEIVASGSFSGGSFTATWKPPLSRTFNSAGTPLQRSRRFLVQFFGEDGTPLYSVTTSETSVTAALTGPMHVGAFYWNVQALDADGVVIGRSELQKAVRPDAR